MLDIKEYLPIDQALFGASQKVKAVYYFEPLNKEEEKRKFLKDRIRNPRFIYRDLEYQPGEVEEKLRKLRIPNGELGELFKKKRRSLLRRNEMVKNRGRKVVREISLRTHKPPGKRLVKFAERWLEEIPGVEKERVVSSRVIKRTLEAVLRHYGLADWRVEFSDKTLTTVYTAEKKITVGRETKFTKEAPERLALHEVSVHVLRGANGLEQLLKIFALGLPGYLETEEGLALYFEELTGKMPPEKKRDYASRVIAVDSVCQSLDFRRTFKRLKSYGLTDNQSWNMTLRAHRGGGYVKCHLYLKGFLKIKEFAKKDGDFKTLFLGRVGLSDLSLVRKLLRRGVIKPAKYLPDFLQT